MINWYGGGLIMCALLPPRTSSVALRSGCMIELLMQRTRAVVRQSPAEQMLSTKKLENLATQPPTISSKSIVSSWAASASLGLSSVANLELARQGGYKR